MNSTNLLLLTTALTVGTVLVDSTSVISRAQTFASVTQDLGAVNNSARDFFEAGRLQFEREIYLLGQRDRFAQIQLLDLDAEVQPQEDLQRLEPPSLQRLQGTPSESVRPQ